MDGLVKAELSSLKKANDNSESSVGTKHILLRLRHLFISKQSLTLVFSAKTSALLAVRIIEKSFPFLRSFCVVNYPFSSEPHHRERRLCSIRPVLRKPLDHV